MPDCRDVRALRGKALALVVVVGVSTAHGSGKAQPGTFTDAALRAALR